MGGLLSMMERAGLLVDDLRKLLPTNGKVPWGKRELEEITGCVIHHTTGKDYPARDLANYHIRIKTKSAPDGFPGIAYTFLVHEGGGIDFCHRLRDWGPHAGYVNPNTFGIALGGMFTQKRPEEKMLDALVMLVRVLDEFFLRTIDRRLIIVPHFSVSATACPGRVWEAFKGAWE